MVDKSKKTESNELYNKFVKISGINKKSILGTDEEYVDT